MSWRRAIGELLLIHPPAVVAELTLGQMRTMLATLAELRSEEMKLQAALAGVRFG